MDVGIPTQSVTGNRILAISDLNSDKNDDLVTSNTEGTVITIYYWDSEDQMYSATSQITLPQKMYV